MCDNSAPIFEKFVIVLIYGVYYPRQEGHGETLKLVSQGMNKRGIKGTDYTEKKLFTLYTMRSVFIFSLLFSVHLVRC